MQISIVVAVSTNNVIGVDGNLPWHISEDLRRFKDLTMGKPMIMGRKTYESIGRALPGRRSIILTRNDSYAAEDCEVALSPDTALTLAGDVDEVMVIGGGKVYEQMLPISDRIYLTRVHAEIDGDTFFPEPHQDEWKTIAEEDYPEEEGRAVGYTFFTLQRI